VSVLSQQWVQAEDSAQEDFCHWASGVRETGSVIEATS